MSRVARLATAALGDWRSAAPRPSGSREFTDRVLADLRAARWSPRGWARFLAASAERSVAEAGRRPLAAAEVTALHAAVFAVRPGWWAPASWLLPVTHLGLLGERATLGWANRLSIVRGLLPAMATDRAPWLAGAALATDWADGRMARAEVPTAFGFYADPLADAAFWTWFVLRHEPSRMLRAAALAAWTLPVTAITVRYLADGRSTDYPRPVLVRNASVALQVWVAARAGISGRRASTGGTPPRRTRMCRRAAASSGCDPAADR